MQFDMLESSITTLIDNKVSKKLISDYPDINFITEPNDDTDYKFPCVYIHEMDMSEMANTLSGKTVNAVQHTLQIEVSSNKKKADAKRVVYEVADVLKEKGYRLTMMPVYSKYATIHTYITRATRLIGSGDKL